MGWASSSVALNSSPSHLQSSVEQRGVIIPIVSARWVQHGCGSQLNENVEEVTFATELVLFLHHTEMLFVAKQSIF